MRIGLDIMGGDFAPEATVKGAVMARQELPSQISLVLFGDEHIISEQLSALGQNSDGAASRLCDRGRHGRRGAHQTAGLYGDDSD